MAAGKRIGGGSVVKGHGLPGISDVASGARLSGIEFRIEACLVDVLMATDTRGSDVPEFPRTRFFVAFGAGSSQVGTGEGKFPRIVHVYGEPADRKTVWLVASVAIPCHPALCELAVVKVLVTVGTVIMPDRLLYGFFMTGVAGYRLVFAC